MTTPQDYQGIPKDTVDKFHGNQLLYIGWEDHLMFCAPFAFPFPPAMRFGDIVSHVLPGAFGYHPDFAKIDWPAAQWFKSGQPFSPGVRKRITSLCPRPFSANERSKSGLTGIKGSFS